MRPLAAALLLGAATVLGFAPFGLFPLPIASLALLFALCARAASPRRAAACGFAWGLGCFLAGVSWVYVSMHDVGGMAAPIAVLATLLFCALLAVFPAAAAGLLRWRMTRRPWRDALLAAALWTLAEWARGWVLTGFPWLATGYAQTPPSPLAGYAPLVGVYGVGFAAALLAGLLAFAWRRSAAVIAMLAVLAGGAALRPIAWTIPAGAPLSVALLQGNIPQSLKWEPGRARQSLDTYVRLAESHPAELTVLPETALPLLLADVPDDVLRRLAGRGALLAGVPLHDAAGYANAAVAFAAPYGSAPPQIYAKSHLVPFGEVVPPGFNWFLDLMRIPLSDFTPGPPRQAPLAVAGQRLAPNICYEDIFGEQIIAALPAATLLVNMSNTAWFGASLAQPQHLQIARMRALETGRSMLRATNTGMTALIRPDGSVAAALPPFSEGALSVAAQGYAGSTPYARLGNSPTVIVALLLAAILSRRRPAGGAGDDRADDGR